MNPFAKIMTGIGSAIGLVLVGALVFFLWRVNGELKTVRNAKDEADKQRLIEKVADLEGRVALRDSIAKQQATTFLTARERSVRQPIVTGGGPKADAIANAALKTCFDQGAAALSACQVARVTADSVPILRDSIFNIEKRLIAGKRRRWTAHGGAFYAWPEKAPLVRAETQFRIVDILSVNAGIEKSFVSARTDSIERAMQVSPLKTWRGYVGATIPFR